MRRSSAISGQARWSCPGRDRLRRACHRARSNRLPSGSSFCLQRRWRLVSSLRQQRRTSADHAWPAHAASDHGRVAGVTADRRENALGDVHAVDIVRRGFLADQNHRAFRGKVNRVFGGEGGTPNCRARRSRQTGGDLRADLCACWDRRRDAEADRAGAARRAARLPSL